MKILITLLTIVFCTILFTGCSKDGDTPLTAEQQSVKYLVGDGNRYWHLSKLYVNSVPQTLTDAQSKYTKTYTIGIGQNISGTFTNSDGYNGTWKLLFANVQLQETINNNQAGPVQVIYDINKISQDTLDIMSTANLKTVREVYYAY
jgi:hypothetical protein